MKSRLFCLLALAHLSCSIQSARAQISATVEIDTYAGLTVTGTEGWYYNIEATDDLADSGSWSVVETIHLDPGPVLWFDGSAPVTGKRFYRVAIPPVLPVPNMVLIPSGSFVMGSPDTELYRGSEEGPQTTVTFSRDFYMGKYEVTQEEYLAIIGTNPSFFRGDPTLPVDSVNWTTAAAYCDALTTAQRVAGRCPSDWSYRLPTEAEWEYVCRAGTTTFLPYGEGATTLGFYEWFQDNSDFITHPVGQKPANPWGIHDMLGNVSEWCLDWSGPYPGGSVTDWVQPTTSFTRALRGGYYLTDYRYIRSAARNRLSPDAAVTPPFGFRVVLAPIQ